MKLYGGIDLHSNNCVVVLINEEGKEIFRRRIPNDLEYILRLLNQQEQPLEGLVVESTYN